MSTQTETTSTIQRRQRRVQGVLPERTVGGIVLVAIGLIIIVSRLIPGFGQYVLLAVGITCLIAFVLTREYGYGVAAGIVGGLGVGVVLSGIATDPYDGMVFMLSLAAGFFTIWVLGFFAEPPERNPWPLIPAVILAVVGLSIATDSPGLLDWLIVVVAAVLVIVGLRAFRSSRQSDRAAA
jgi:hypothetical protein